jgi:hypothetical protein
LLPVAVICQALFETGVEIAIHIVLAIGAALLSLAIFDFKTARWITWPTVFSTTILAIIFSVQAISLVLPGDEMLFYIAFTIFGQGIEGWLGNIFIIWCAVLLVTGSRGKIRVFGLIATALVICAKIVEYSSRYRGEPPPEPLKLLMLLLFVWFLFESAVKRDVPDLSFPS